MAAGCISRVQNGAGPNKGAKSLESNLAVLISDLHVNGLKQEVPTHLYEEKYLEKTVAMILAMDPLPENVVCFGDIAYHWGQRADYDLAAKLLQPLTAAGIRLTLGMGNHDRRGNFLEVWPEYAKTSPVPGRIVSKVELPHVDLLMLDTLNALEVFGERTAGDKVKVRGEKALVEPRDDLRARRSAVRAEEFQQLFLFLKKFFAVGMKGSQFTSTHP